MAKARAQTQGTRGLHLKTKRKTISSCPCRGILTQPKRQKKILKEGNVREEGRGNRLGFAAERISAYVLTGRGSINNTREKEKITARTSSAKEMIEPQSTPNEETKRARKSSIRGEIGKVARK